MKEIIASLLFSVISLTMVQAQPDRWQQAAKYDMEIDFDVEAHQFRGKQKLEYTNNSPDTLDQVFYHLYFNAFQPGSMMDVRNQWLADSDRRIGNRITNLKPDEIGFQHVSSLKKDGKDVAFETVGTILEVTLADPVLPGQTVSFDMEFNAQVPVQIRRSGRDNAEGVSYSMSQWYPKMCEYDYQGWHANPYIGREFYGIWGDFDVKITIDSDYILGGTGYLQNANEIGYGYEEAGSAASNAGKEKLTWHFFAPNVHDFVWAADPDYKHITYTREDGITMHFLYQENEDTKEVWNRLPTIMDEAFDYIQQHFGKYPYEQYSFIQGGDGGMEYPMATLITGERNLGSLTGVSVHELMHSWFQMVLGTNEALYAWMDEGFTTWASNEVMNHLKKEGLLPGSKPVDNPHANTYAGYVNLTKSGVEEPLTTHADHFQTNYAYGQASYTKGSVFLNQIRYIVGEENFKKGMLRYYNTWKFKHPNTNDFIRIMEKVSGLELDWYKQYFVQTTYTIDYGIEDIDTGSDKRHTKISFSREGLMPMPVDFVVEMTNGDKEYFTIPLQIMRGSKTNDGDINYTTLSDWGWVYTEYEVELPIKIKKVKSVTIDPLGRLADIDSDNDSKKVSSKKRK
ncbi:MAG: M1 family metallopeptidase [Bacteroidetes bacterium]|nr:M1 family metallopeptidase [Bacteroidota bacterium]